MGWHVLLGIVMRNTLVEKGLRCMLAALVLLATFHTHSTYVHGHSGGNLSHGHSEADDYTRSQLPVAPYDGNDVSAYLSADEVHRHQCLALLGTITSKSTSGERTDSHDKSTCCGTPIAAISASHGVRGLAKSPSLDHTGLIAVTNLTTDYVCQVKQSESFAGVAPVSILCDRARHERSGVLLT